MCVVESASVAALNWGMPFLNDDRKKRQICCVWLAVRLQGAIYPLLNKLGYIAVEIYTMLVNEISLLLKHFS